MLFLKERTPERETIPESEMIVPFFVLVVSRLFPSQDLPAVPLHPRRIDHLE